MKRFIFGFVIAVVTTLGAQATPGPTSIQPSFDCLKSATTVEKLICQSAELSVLDGLLVYAYKTALSSENNLSTKEALKKEQVEWVKEARNTCRNVDCLKAAYSDRIADNFVEFETYNSYLQAQGWEKAQYRKGSRFCDFEYKRGLAVIVVNVYCAGDGFNTLSVK